MSVTWEGGALHVRLAPPRLLEIAYWIVALAFGAVQAWVFRFQPSTVDAISYLDIGDAYTQGRWSDGLNGCWNPLYSWMLGLAMAIVQPTARMEYPVAKAVDFAIFVAALAAFRWFLKGFLAAQREAMDAQGDRMVRIPEVVWLVIGYTIFLWSSLNWIRVTSSTPDMGGAALTYLAWGLMYRLRSDPTTVRAATLGVVLALAYYMRSPMLGVGALMILCLFWQQRTNLRPALVTALVLALLTAPFIVALSMAHGHVTIGDNGKLNHAWLANPGSYLIPDTNWQGGPAGYGAPRHPTRLVWNALPTYEFATPIGGTYPPWTDPSYWYEGLTYRFDAAAEWGTLRDNLIFYGLLFGLWLALVLGVVLLAGGDAKATARAARINAGYWAPAAAGLALHAVASNLLIQWLPAQPLSRYVGAFGALVCLIAIGCLRVRPMRERAAQVALTGFAAIIGVAVIGALAAEHAIDLRDGMQRRVSGREGRLYAAWPPWDVAERLQRTGLVSPGARVAIVGEKSRHAYWARLIRARIIAQVPDDGEFWRRSVEERALILQVLAQTGADVVVSSRIRPGDPSRPDWLVAEGTDYAVRRLELTAQQVVGR